MDFLLRLEATTVATKIAYVSLFNQEPKNFQSDPYINAMNFFIISMEHLYLSKSNTTQYFYQKSLFSFQFESINTCHSTNGIILNKIEFAAYSF